jgi:hypothetical protein
MTETETKWSERVREWKASGRTAKEFAEGREFKASTLVYWASCLRRDSGSAAQPKKREARIRMARVIAARPQAGDAIVVAVGVARVTVRSGFDPALLKRVVQALRDDR